MLRKVASAVAQEVLSYTQPTITTSQRFITTFLPFSNTAARISISKCPQLAPHTRQCLGWNQKASFASNTASKAPGPAAWLSSTAPNGARSFAVESEPTMRYVRVTPKQGWAAVPMVPMVLGFTGLIPFYALSPPLIKGVASMCTDHSFVQTVLTDLLPMAGTLQLGYGTAVVAFLGAVHWGAAMQSRTGHTTKIMFERYVWSVMPALTAFPATAMAPNTGCIVIIMSSIAALAVDFKFQYKGALPKWYMYLRVPLTIGACLAVGISLWGVISEQQSVLDYEHYAVQEPRMIEPEPDAAAFR